MTKCSSILLLSEAKFKLLIILFIICYYLHYMLHTLCLGPKRKDDGKTNDANYRINTTNVDLTLTHIKLLLTLVEFK